MAQVMNLEMENSVVGTEWGRCLLCRECEKERLLLLKYTKTQRRREDLLKNKWPNVNEEITLRKLLPGKRNIDLRNLGTLACKSNVRGKNS
jgi:hypothetical protein